MCLCDVFFFPLCCIVNSSCFSLLDHFVECHICYSLKQSMYNYLNGVTAAQIAKEAFAIHVNDFSNDINQLDRYRDLAVLTVGALFLMIDGMSQQTSRMPHETRHTGVFGQHLIGAVVNCFIGTFGNATSEMKYIFLLFDHLAAAGGDETIEVLVRLLLLLRNLNLTQGTKPWPTTLYLQVDGARYEEFGLYSFNTHLNPIIFSIVTTRIVPYLPSVLCSWTGVGLEPFS